jgi:hypothetical protein
MQRKIYNLRVQIMRYVDDSQPGWVACEFEDAEGHRHTLIDKGPIFTSESLRSNSSYPKPGGMPCEVLATWWDSNGRELARISTEYPLYNRSAEGQSEFVVLSSELVGSDSCSPD